MCCNCACALPIKTCPNCSHDFCKCFWNGPSLLQKLPEHNVSLLMLLLFGCMYVMSFLRPNEYAKNLGNTKSYLFRVQVWYILHSSLSAMKEKFRPWYNVQLKLGFTNITVFCVACSLAAWLATTSCIVKFEGCIHVWQCFWLDFTCTDIYCFASFSCLADSYFYLHFYGDVITQ